MHNRSFPNACKTSFLASLRQVFSHKFCYNIYPTAVGKTRRGHIFSELFMLFVIILLKSPIEYDAKHEDYRMLSLCDCFDLAIWVIRCAPLTFEKHIPIDMLLHTKAHKTRICVILKYLRHFSINFFFGTEMIRLTNWQHLFIYIHTPVKLRVLFSIAVCYQC